MFVYNVKLSRTNIFKALLVIAIIIFLILFGIAMYKIISASLEQSFKVEDNLFKDGIATLTCDNYTDVLKMVHNDIDTYIGQKIKFSGYVYKAPDFKETEFVLARNMLVNNNTQSIIVGFLCDSKDIDKYEEGTWVEITGEITKGNYHGDIPIIKITQIDKIQKPEDEYVYPPDDNYIPTSVIM